MPPLFDLGLFINFTIILENIIGNMGRRIDIEERRGGRRRGPDDHERIILLQGLLYVRCSQD